MSDMTYTLQYPLGFLHHATYRLRLGTREEKENVMKGVESCVSPGTKQTRCQEQGFC